MKRLPALTLALAFALSLGAQPRQDFRCHLARKSIDPAAFQAWKENLTHGNERSDTFDVLHHHITLDVTDFAGQTIRGTCAVRLRALLDSLPTLTLDLLDLTVDSIRSAQGDSLAFSYDGRYLFVHFPQPLAQGDTAEVRISYHGHPTADPSGFGGFVFDDGIAYNLGIGLGSFPFNFGRSWFPCFDNFVERATYELNIIARNEHKAFAVGSFIGQTDLGDGTSRFDYRMNQPLPTYLVGVAVGPYTSREWTHPAANGDLPVLLVAKGADIDDMENSFQHLGDAIDALEAWYGPYWFERVGYVLTTAGAMEHATLIAYPDFVGVSGPTPNQNRLMAHELAHHWWGNVTTLTTPADMWIKEGNAEYGAHLFVEHTFGKEAFREVVISNHREVLEQAHIDDGAFLALSGMPLEQTYGTHTYLKGAAMMHNLRAYLGDSTFSQAMTEVLETHPYSALDAAQFRDALSQASGKDLTAFFDDWIFSPGFSNFEIESMSVEGQGAPFSVRLAVQQKLRAAPHYHSEVPLDVTFFGADWQQEQRFFEASGPLTEVSFELPFEPVLAVLNATQRLNLARLQRQVVLRQEGEVTPADVNLVRLDVLEMGGDSALLAVVHHYTAPDTLNPNPHGIRLSSTHWWSFRGLFPEGFRMNATLRYAGSNPNAFDYDLTGQTEDSLILVWRPEPQTPWEEYPHYTKLAFGTTDGNGFIRIDTLLPGDYAFANGAFPTATTEPTPQTTLRIHPNPATHTLFIRGEWPLKSGALLQLFDVQGQLVRSERVSTPEGRLDATLQVDGLPPGLYFLKLAPPDGEAVGGWKVVVE